MADEKEKQEDNTPYVFLIAFRPVLWNFFNNESFKIAANAPVTPIIRNVFAAKLKESQKMEPYKNLRFKKNTAERFQEFSKKHFKTHSEAMATMLDFFLYNQISPKENFGPTAKTLEKTLKKRMNAIIAIMKDIEKTQTKPTVAILNALIEQAEPQKEPRLIEKKTFPQEENYWNVEPD